MAGVSGESWLIWLRNAGGWRKLAAANGGIYEAAS